MTNRKSGVKLTIGTVKEISPSINARMYNQLVNTLIDPLTANAPNKDHDGDGRSIKNKIGMRKGRASSRQSHATASGS